MKKIVYILFAAVLMITACIREMTPEQSVRTTPVPPKDGDMAVVTFSVTIPETSLYAIPTRAQYAMGEQPSIANGDLYVAVFGLGENDEKGLGGVLQHYVPAKLKNTIAHDLTEVDGETTTYYKYEYEVLLPLSNDPLILTFMAGACDSLGHLFTSENPLPLTVVKNGKTENAYEDDVMPLIHTQDGYAAYSQRIRIPGVYPKMENGEYVYTQYEDPEHQGEFLPDADQDYVADPIEQLHNVQLIRNFAKVTFTAPSTANFTLNKFWLVDTPVYGTVAPYSASTGYVTPYMSPAANAASVMGTYPGFELVRELSEGYEADPNKWLDPGTFDYMYERSIPTNSTSPAYGESGAILQVTWKNVNAVPTALRGQTCYYKVAFVDSAGFTPILRNIQYDFEVSEINATNHPTTPAAAYAGEFLGDISANLATSMLDEISNNKSKIQVTPMVKTVIGRSNEIEVDFWFYPVASNSEVVVTDGKHSNAANADVAIAISSKLEVSGFPQAIKTISGVEVTRVGNADQKGTIKVQLDTAEAGKVKKGKVRILGQVVGQRALYREVEFTVMPKQVFKTTTGATCTVTSPISDAMNQDVTVTIKLPDALPRDIFPLQIMIEAEQNNLTSIPDKTVTPNISAIPVKYGPSAFRPGNSYYFVKTITFDEYATLSGQSYTYTNSFPCKFKTRLSTGNTTRIRINDLTRQYFEQTELTLTAN